MIDVGTIRTAIQDVPKVIPPNASPPETLGMGDGATTRFFFRERPLLTEPLAVSFGAIANGYQRFTEVQPNSATFPWSISSGTYGSVSILFTVAPANGVVVGARYSTTMFTDAELIAYRNRADVYSTDRQTLMGIQADLIGAMLMSDDKMRIYSFGDSKSDPSVVRAALSAQQMQIRSELTAQAATSSPAMRTGSFGFRPYIR